VKSLSRIRSKLASLQLSPLTREVRDEHLTYLSVIKLRRMERALARVSRLSGGADFLEFGVALGGSAIVVANAAVKAGGRFMGFDVFGMIPPPTSEKDDTKSRQRYEVIASGKSQGIAGDRYYGYRDDLYGDVVRAFGRHGLEVDGKRVSLKKGLFQDTWSDRQPGPIAFAHIDCDWYDPVKFCLESIADQMLPNGIIVLDDYHDYGGCKTAVDEFLKARSDFAMEDGENPMLVRSRLS